MEKMSWKYIKKIGDKNIVLNYLKNNNVNIPKKLIECIIENNGGRPSINEFDTENGKGYLFQSLISYNSTDESNIYEYVNKIFNDKEKYPIAIETAGNVICYDQKNKKFVLWNHETNLFENILEKENPLFVSFEE